MNKQFIITLLLLTIGSVFAENKTQFNNNSASPLEINIINKSHSLNQLSLLVENETFNFKLTKTIKNQNGDVFIESRNKAAYLQATIGNNSLFGQLHTRNKHYIINTTQSGIHAIDVSNKDWHINDCGVKHNQPPFDLKTFQNHSKGDPDNVIDVFFLYSNSILDRYPGELLETRLNQYINVANQSFANSNIDLSVRKVGQELKTYNLSENNVDLLYDLRTSLTGSPIIGIGNLELLRNEYGVDIFVYIRPHDILTRGNCGVAFYPAYQSETNTFDTSYGVQVMSDGVSSWSVCTDQLFIHELGHNLGAAHHNASEENQFLQGGAGFAKSGVVTTIMGSFGTGQAERFMEVDMFSNPSLNCAGISCGETDVFDNTNAINTVKNFVANYAPALSNLPIDRITTRSNKDSDNDGVNDWEDFIPFDSSEQFDSDLDGVGDNADVFPNNPNEQFDFDQDGVGDNEDGDDDNDGTQDFSDAFPFDSSEQKDSDGDGYGDNTDQFPNNLFESIDYDNDSIGDNQDADDDNDSYIDINNWDLLIVNAGSSTMSRIDAVNGNSYGFELTSADSHLTFQSDLAYRSETNTLYYTGSSSINSLNLMSRTPKDYYIPPYAKNSFDIQLFSGFPTSLTSVDNGDKILTSLMGRNYLWIYKGQNQANQYGDIDLGFSLNDFNREFQIIDLHTIDGITYGLDANKHIYKFSNFSFPFNVEEVSINNSTTLDWLDQPYAIATNNNDSLFITDIGHNKVFKLDLVNQTVDTDFIDFSDHGSSAPTGIVMTQSNELLVAARDQNSILKFNAETGDYLGELISNNGLDQPHKMVLVPQLKDRFHNDADKVIRPNAGLWYNPETSGRGFDIEVFNNNLSVIWYTFDENGLPIWYISSGELNGFEFSSVFHKTHLNTDASLTLEEVGSISIHFDNERKAQITWQINENKGSEPLQWLTWSTKETLGETNYTGLWGRPDGPGWGVSVATIGSTSVAIPYIYDSAGEPRWLISNPTSTASPLSFDLNAVFSDTLCPSCIGISEYTTQASGSMIMNLGEDKSWDSEIEFPSPIIGEWNLNNTDLRLFSSDATRPR